MKLIPIITCLALCGVPIAFAEEAPKAEGEAGKLPWNKPLPGGAQIEVRPGQIELDLDLLPQGGIQLPAPQTEAIPKEYAEEKTVALKLEDLVRDESGLRLTLSLRFINPTDKPVVFTGYSEKSPLIDTHYWVDGKWVNATERGFCGTGLRQCTIAPGQSVVIHAGLEGEKLPGRVGVSYQHGANKERTMVWSEKIER